MLPIHLIPAIFTSFRRKEKDLGMGSWGGNENNLPALSFRITPQKMEDLINTTVNEYLDKTNICMCF